MLVLTKDPFAGRFMLIPPRSDGAGRRLQASQLLVPILRHAPIIESRLPPPTCEPECWNCHPKACYWECGLEPHVLVFGFGKTLTFLMTENGGRAFVVRVGLTAP